MYLRKINITPDNKGDGWMIDTPREFIHCKDKHEVGAYIEQAIWPLCVPCFNGRKSIKITIEESDE